MSISALAVHFFKPRFELIVRQAPFAGATATPLLRSARNLFVGKRDTASLERDTVQKSDECVSVSHQGSDPHMRVMQLSFQPLYVLIL